jgi:YVTN family beta-propeller protein
MKDVTVGLLTFLALAALSWGALAGQGLAQAPGSISGSVRLADGRAAAGAWVRSQTTANLAITAPDGGFTLTGLSDSAPITVTAWYTDHKVGWAVVTPPAANVVLILRPYDSRDNPDYAWNTSYADPANPTLGCGHCMAPSFAEWSDTAHAGSATNRRFLSLYNGTDLSGARVIAPGYKSDFPGTAGNCATCHAPGAAYDAPFTTDMNTLTGVNREGVFCEFCHKVGAVYLNPATGRPYNNAPGTISMRLFRPFASDQLFFGSLDDVARRVSYLPLEQRSQFCAPCHQFSFWGTPIYQSYREWQESPYPARGVQCQTCHQPPGTSPTFVLPEKGGLARDPARLASHRDLGLKDTTFMQSTVALTVTTQTIASTLHVSVTLTNVGAGHHVPTDSPLRNMVLVITGTTGPGQALLLQTGPTVPTWGGGYAGQPGQGYAKILKDALTGAVPAINYWKQTLIVSDNRLPALGSDTTNYVFALPAGDAPATITATLIFRRAFQAEELARDWPASDILMAQATATTANQQISKYPKGTMSANERGGETASQRSSESASERISESANECSGAAVAQQSEVANRQSAMPETAGHAVANPQSVKRSSSAIAITADGRLVLAVNPDSNTLSLVDAFSRTLLAEIPVGVDPRTVAVDDAGTRAYVVNRGSGSVSVVDLAARATVATIPVGPEPWGVVTSPDGRDVYVAVTGADRIAVLDGTALTVTQSLPVADRPAGLALSDDGRTLYATHLLTDVITVLTVRPATIYLPLILADPAANQSISVRPLTFSRQSPLSDTPSAIRNPQSAISLWPDSNLVQSIVFSPDRRRAYVPHTRANTSNRALTFDTTVFPLVSLIDLTTGQHLVGQQLDLGTLDPPGVGLPFDAALTPVGSEIWVVNAASNNVTVLNLTTRQRVASIPVGDNPRGIVLAPDGGTAYVNNTLAGTVSLVDTAAYTVSGVITTTAIPLPPALLRGKQLFHSSNRPDLAKARWISCNTCHFEGSHDGRTWTFGFAGPRNTTSLLGMIQTYPLRWSAEWNESADSEFAIRKENFGNGLIAGAMNCLISPPDCVNQPPNQGHSYDLDALALFLDSLETPRSPAPLDAAAQRGQAIFSRPALNCLTCHPPPLYTDQRKHDVSTATADEKIGPAYDTPTLKGLYDSAPYFHDGSAATLRDALTRPSAGSEHDLRARLTEQEMAELSAFLLALPFE